MIAAVIGEELGMLGIAALIGLYGMFAYAGLKIAQNARDRYGKLLAAGLTSLVLVQALVNLLAVFGMAPLTGVPLPLVSYGNASMMIMLAAVGLLLNIARGGSVGSATRPSSGGARLRVVDGAQGGHSRGGTAGHVVPALAVADALRAEGAEVSFLGADDRAEAELVPAAGYEIDLLRLRGLDRGNPVRAVGSLRLAAAAVPAARRVLRDRGAQAVLGGGGYVAGPAGLAALSLGLPLVLTEADRHLGLTNRLLARRARRICLAFPIPGREGERYLVTGRPVPAAIGAADRDRARERFGIASSGRCLLVFGGSQGARSINRCALEAFAGAAAADRAFHVLHISGTRDYDEARDGSPRAGTRPLHPARIRARPRRRSRGVRPGARPRGRIDLRDRRRRPARDPRSLSTRSESPPARERRLDGGRGCRRGRRGLRARPGAAAAAGRRAARRRRAVA